MMIKFIKGDLLESNAEILVNTVNTVGVMGKGVALRFRDVFPHNYRVYQHACRTGSLHIGKLLIVKDGNLLTGEKTIINFPTKTHWRIPSEYSYVKSGLCALRKFLMEHTVAAIAMPAPGCGNGGLSYHRVKAMIEECLSGLDVDITVYEPHTG